VIVQGKGWGWSVLWITLGWLIPVFGFAIVTGMQEPGPHGDDRLFNELCALWLLLSAMSVYAVDRYREGVARRKRNETAGPFPEVIRDDEFLFMRMWAWPYVLVALALAALISSRFV